jgi:hypothetical protein
VRGDPAEITISTRQRIVVLINSLNLKIVCVGVPIRAVLKSANTNYKSLSAEIFVASLALISRVGDEVALCKRCAIVRFPKGEAI